MYVKTSQICAAQNSISPERIELASRIIDPMFLNSPVVSNGSIDGHAGAELVIKVETLNPIRSFKGRGTDFLVRELPKGADRLVTASAGNFGQGLAYAAHKNGLSLTVYAAETASPSKVAAMRRLGAEVRLAGHDLDAAKSVARDHAQAHGELFIEDGAHASLAEGAGTIARELTASGGSFDAVVMPLGNGALLTGVGAWMKRVSQRTQVIGVVAEGAPAMQLSFAAGRAVETTSARTIADGIAVRVPVSFALHAMRDTVDDVLAVSDEIMLQAVRLVHGTIGIVAEPAGVAGLAAILAYPSRFQGQRLATALCGGNLSPQQIREWLFPPGPD